MNDTGQYNREIKEAVQRLAGTFLKDGLSIIQATVTDVDTTKYTCTCSPISGDSTTTFTNVNLSANNNKGFIPLPALQSTVLVAVSIKNNPPYLIGWDLLQGLICIVQNTNDGSISQLIIQNGIVQINDGSYGGLIQIDQLVTKINNIENLLNEFIGTYNTHTHLYAPGPGTPAPTDAPVSTESNTIAPTTQRSDLENTKVTHGI